MIKSNVKKQVLFVKYLFGLLLYNKSTVNKKYLKFFVLIKRLNKNNKIKLLNYKINGKIFEYYFVSYMRYFPIKIIFLKRK